MGSRKLPGKSSEMAETKLAAAPNTKKMLKAVTPRGRILSLKHGRTSPSYLDKREVTVSSAINVSPKIT
jgi:hypothetical protein